MECASFGPRTLQSDRRNLVLNWVEQDKKFKERYRISETLEIVTLVLLVGFIMANLVSKAVVDWVFAVVGGHPWLLAFAPLLIVPGLAFYIASLVRSLIYATIGLLLVRAMSWLLDQDNPGHHLRWF